ncbi:Nif3-like dinuclear metal center hexameric protein [Massilibacterium senegalense]|uniref:Nif3-like dinuclear metal center hexameric protein n=1 Tax=Massilibacterium senegalense TaxID=1632858 RepID=UPI0007861120|nr:Nif3-like dinuclear metal center hexameric protein [Massilibacterium senegalense]
MKKFAKSQTVIQLIEQLAPKHFAYEGDPIGLQVGSYQKEVKKILVTLDVLEAVVDEAIEHGVDMIVAHHPLIFRPIKKIDTSTSYGRMIQKLLIHDITVYAAHTNLDIANGGVNDLMAEALELENVEVLIPTQSAVLKKLVVFVPASHEQLVRKALGDAGAGFIGAYSHCSFSSKGEGRFLPTNQANPYIGEVGKLEVVEEVRIETILPESMEKQVIRAMLEAHPYEEVAYDLYTLDQKGEMFGLGRLGTLNKEMTLQSFAHLVKQSFDVEGVRVVGDLQAPVKKVAVLGGDGNKYMAKAKMRGADVYVTGDLYYHIAHDAQAIGLHCVDPGHNVEKVMKKGLMHYLKQELTKRKYETDVILSTVKTDPFQFQ